MKIVYVTSSLPHGKKEAFIIPEVNELKRRGHEILIVPAYPRGKVLHGDAGPLTENTAYERLLSLEIVRRALREFARAPVKALRALGCLFHSRSVGVLLRNLLIYPKGLWLADLARGWTTDHVHAHWATVPATMALVASEVSGVTWSVTTHRFDISEDNLLQMKVRRACFVRAISRRGAREIVARVSPELPPPVVIHMGVPMPPVSPTQQPGLWSPPRLVVVANLLEVKGHTYLIKAIRILEERGIHVQVDIAGDGPLREELAADAEGLEVGDRVKFLGLLGHEMLLQQLEAGRWDMLVLPSIITEKNEQEGIPVALIEAMSYRVPVISTITGGIPELFEGINDPPLVPPRDPETLAAAIERLITDAGLRERLTQAGRRRVEESFAIEASVAELIKRFEACGEVRRR